MKAMKNKTNRMHLRSTTVPTNPDDNTDDYDGEETVYMNMR